MENKQYLFTIYQERKKEDNENMGRTHFIIILNSIWILKISISRTYKINHQNYTQELPLLGDQSAHFAPPPK